MGLMKEFREFAVKGNVIDLAVGVIIGAAFGKITSSLVEDIIMPPLGLVLGKVDFTQLKLVLRPAEGTSPAVTLNYGNFINIVIQFLILAFCVFLIIKAINSAKKRFEEEPPPVDANVKACPFCMEDISIKATKCKYCTADLGPTPAQV
jgi:large conductance mechanosensitive channel